MSHVMLDDMLRHWSVTGALTVGVMPHVMARVIAHHRCADGNGKLRPQGMKYFCGFSGDFRGDFGVIFGGVLSAAMIGF